MFSPVFIRTENQLNKLLKQQKKTGEEVNLLFVSLWDGWCETLVNNLKKNKKGKRIYIVNTFDTPHASVIFDSYKLPQLVKVKGTNREVEEYLPRIYKFLGI